jgi:hypothetical protein
MSTISQDNPTPPSPSPACRFCASCWGVCYWHKVIKAWLCPDCGRVWYPDRNPQRYRAPTSAIACG